MNEIINKCKSTIKKCKENWDNKSTEEKEIIIRRGLRNTICGCVIWCVSSVFGYNIGYKDGFGIGKIWGKVEGYEEGLNEVPDKKKE